MPTVPTDLNGRNRHMDLKTSESVTDDTNSEFDD
jgi:hypothetical protein